MSGIFPRPGDGTLPPNPNDPGNPIRAYPPFNTPLDTAALYYGNGCDVRLRPEVMNSLISEMAALTDIAELHYNPAIQTNIQLATRYISQRGLARSAIAVRVDDSNVEPNIYTVDLDPPATRYNDRMLLLLVPTHRNHGTVRIDVNGLGQRPVYRWDGTDLRRRDWVEHIPLLVGYFNDAWYMLSQVTLVKYGSLDVWVRTDGSDETGDGEFNTAESAFRTIQHAWNDVATRYAFTPTFNINIRLGIAGTYDGAEMSSFGGTLRIFGDESAQDSYRVKLKSVTPALGSCLGFSAINFVEVRGICHVIDKPFPPMAGFGTFVGNGTNCLISNCSYENEATNPPGAYMLARSRSTMYTQGTIRCKAANMEIGTVIASTEASQYMNSEGLATQLYCNDMYVGHGVWCYAGSVMDLSGHTIYNSNTTGPRWGVSGNSIILAHGQAPPGNAAGSQINAGIYIP